MIQLPYENEVSDQLIRIIGISGEIIYSLEKFFSKEGNVEMVNNLASQLTILSVSDNTSNSIFSGKIVVFTGTFLTMKRKEAQEKTESLGAKVSSSVSQNTDFVIVGKDPGSKYQEAVKLGIKILTEEEWIKQSSI
ncbi:BRCT domain-containing protein [Wolbachia endosymbiont of Ctenocephalides felis wCfeJ]|uniref:BRCT domain-containing protein n=1 Tax=Wolbachia endosymbiont of Ctenocephalides felis wCfeJ TaxID=2732594 RepID=UPI001446D6CB|nr:BRCT domain-containing protein [Wolbachia endosymbiont of Ctenocephalides felis wCfeJ]